MLIIVKSALLLWNKYFLAKLKYLLILLETMCYHALIDISNAVSGVVSNMSK